MDLIGKEHVLGKIKTFYEKTGRVPVSKDYRADYSGSGLPHWQTVKKHFPTEQYDEIIKRALGFETFKELLFSYIQNKNYSSVLFLNSLDLVKNGYWANNQAVARWLTANAGNVFYGYQVRLYSAGTREHGNLYQLVKIYDNVCAAEAC